MEPGQYYQLAGASPEEIKERVRPDAADTVKKELTLDAVVTAESIEADDHEVMHQIEHLAEESERDPQEIVEAMRKNGSYALLQEELARSRALDFLVENAVPVPEEEPDAGEAKVEATVEAGASQDENDEREES
jgi:trigger factor